MGIKILQLNIWQGVYIQKIIERVLKEDFDILHFQEVSGSQLSAGGGHLSRNYTQPTFEIINKENAGIDCFQVFSKAFPEYHGVKAETWQMAEDTSSYFANATFVKNGIKILEEKIVWLNPTRKIANYKDRKIEEDPRNLIALKLSWESKTFWDLNTHLAWGPNPYDADFKMVQAKKLYEFMSKLNEPFVLTGDFNMTPDTKVIKMLSTLGRNLTVENGLTNTLNPKLHSVKKLFPPGFAVDYIITSKDINVLDFKTVEEDLSDHIGLTAEFEV